MKKKLSSMMFFLVCSYVAVAQPATVTVINHTVVDVEVIMEGTDNTFAGGTSYVVSNALSCPPGTTNFANPCVIESGWGWNFCSFGSYSCAPGPPAPPFPWTIIWRDARITIPSLGCSGCVSDDQGYGNFGTSCSFSTPPGPVGTGDFSGGGSCSSHSSTWTRGVLPLTTPEGDNVTIDVY